MDTTWMKNVMGHNENQKKNRKNQVKKNQSHAVVTEREQNHKSRRPSHSQPHVSRPKSNNVVSHNKVDHNDNIPDGKDLNWGLTLSVYSIAVLTALKAALNLTKRDEVVRKLFEHPVKYWLRKCDSTQRMKYKVAKENYLLNTIGHAKKKWIDTHKN